MVERCQNFWDIWSHTCVGKTICLYCDWFLQHIVWGIFCRLLGRQDCCYHMTPLGGCVGSSCNSAHDFASAVHFGTVAAVDVTGVETGVVYFPWSLAKDLVHPLSMALTNKSCRLGGHLKSILTVVSCRGESVLSCLIRCQLSSKAFLNSGLVGLNDMTRKRSLEILSGWSSLGIRRTVLSNAETF